MYVVVNNDAQMNKGKIASQVGHVVMNMALTLVAKQRMSLLDAYQADGMHKKIVLRATEPEMRALFDKYGSNYTCVKIHDAGLTQVPANTLTAIAFEPAPMGTYPELAKLKLL